MELLKYVSIKLSIGLILGILIGYFYNITPFYGIAYTCLSILLLGVLFFKEKRTDSILFGIFMLLTSIGIGITTTALSQPKNNSDHYTHQNYEGSHTWQFKIVEVLKSNTFSNRYIVDVKNIDKHKSFGKLLVSIAKDSTSKKLKVDNEILTYNTISELKPPLNPHQFNYKKYLKHLGIYHQIQLSTEEYQLKKNKATTIYGIAANIRNKIIYELEQVNFGEEELSIIQALLLGQRNDISETTYTNYKNAGAIHILALSGLHIGVLLIILQFLLQPMELLRHGGIIKLITIVLLLWGFAILAGLSASIIRAVTMFSFVAYAQYLNRPTSTFNILALSLFFTLLVKPMLLFQVGFQMSYAAVFAIVWIYPLLQKFWFPDSWVLQKSWQLFSVSIAAQLGVLPISLFYFHQFPGLFFISNLIIIPFLGVLIGLGILVIILALVGYLPYFLVNFYNTIIHTMNAIIKWIAQQEAFIFTAISFDAVQMILSYIICISLVLALAKKSYKKVVLLLLGIISFQCWNFYTMFSTQLTEKLIVMHQTRNTLVLHQSGNKLNILNSNEVSAEKIISDYSIAEHIKNNQHQPIKNSYRINNKTLFIIDSLDIYPSLKTETILLTQSPKINLERFIDSVQPKIIIADGSNYRTSVNRWKKTAMKRKIPFHYTGEKGAYYFDLKTLE